MSNYKFIKTPDGSNRFDDTTVTVELPAESLDNINDAYMEFLRGCGFSVDGKNFDFSTPDPEDALNQEDNAPFDEDNTDMEDFA
jgi:regulator of RNase E activity RraB